MQVLRGLSALVLDFIKGAHTGSWDRQSFERALRIGEASVSILVKQFCTIFQRMPCIVLLEVEVMSVGQNQYSELHYHTGSARYDGEYSPLYRILGQECM